MSRVSFCKRCFTHSRPTAGRIVFSDNRVVFSKVNQLHKALKPS